jgi:hypothetical protein
MNDSSPMRNIIFSFLPSVVMPSINHNLNSGDGLIGPGEEIAL